MPGIARKISLAALAAALPLGGLTGALPPATGQGARPNILVIVTDDQRPTDTMEFLPKTLDLFAGGGTRFTNAHATTPLCCPARSSIMTGRFAHNHLVKTNADHEFLDHNSTIQRYLQQIGYRTAIVGKYLNGFPVANDPPYFHLWNVMQPAYYDTNFNNNGTVEEIEQYSTDFVGDRAEAYIENDVGGADTDPWFLYVAPFAPHGPWTAEGGHPTDDDDYRTADVGTWDGNPAVLETDEGDKPQYVKNATHTLDDARADRQGQLRSLLSVDDMVDQIFTAIEAEDEQDTLAFFLSDNGFFWSEHGLTSKNQPYAQAQQIPFLMRWPGRVAAGVTDARPVANIDIVATIMAALGIAPAPEFPIDGRSLLDPAAHQKMLTEAWPTGSRGPWASIRTAKYQYTEYYDNSGVSVDFREYYDLVVDPWQLTNFFNDAKAKNDPYIGALQDELANARSCVGATCVTLLDEPGIPAKCPGAKKTPGHHLVGSDRRDTIGGIKSRDVICGRDAGDTLRGKGGKDRLIGGIGGDDLLGGPGRDFLHGKAGRDVCRGGSGRDTFRGCEVERG